MEKGDILILLLEKVECPLSLSDDNEDGTPDYDDVIASSSEDDFIKVDLIHTNSAGVGYRLSRSDTKINVFTRADKLDWLYVNPPVTSGTTAANQVYVEWATPESGTSTLKYSVWDTTHNREAIFDSVKFKPFTSVVVVLLGEFQVPADPPPTGAINLANGIINFAIQEYRESGLDVYMYGEYDVDTEGRGPVYDQIVSAINYRGVSNVAMVGYSHGGGKVDKLAWRLAQNTVANSGIADTNKPFGVPFTGYIDAIRARFEGDLIPVNNRPLLSAFHCNQYEQNNPLGKLDGSPNDGDDDFDRSYLGVNHLSIVNNAIVQGFLRMRLRQKVQP
jgi:hypothetical protein